ncbi:carboxypeptidase regulatory-like domain-containing protein [Chloracidobacterium sp. S]|uniref:carboxypeptidase-like regulatory domain-containing protein n=1 Tax=Chloracidobacterium aggregatum TaxID=2851959 RepID=UPI001B8C799E|nr:carboxypeptidase-like regulatory domain-containing protein [Chloracidobacterium aggregatum]QUV89561.1 carboxypeptidase regulatory-like domain-containing protein [Chloracidobacterium sp. S]
MTTCASPFTTRWGRWSWLFLLVLCLGTLNLSALAQIGTGTIRGTVTDEQGAAIAGATVTLTNPATGTTRTQTTNEAGTFSFTGVPAATYTLKVEATNFKAYEQPDIRARVDGSTTVGVVLSVGEATETVTVTGSGSEVIVNRQDASIGNTIAQRQILELPLAARNIAGLLSLQPGVAPDGSVSGSRSDQGNITLDGVDINEQQNNSAFAPVLRTSPESVEEFRVTVSNPNANQGRSSGRKSPSSPRAAPTSFTARPFSSTVRQSATPATGSPTPSGSGHHGCCRTSLGVRLAGPSSRTGSSSFTTTKDGVTARSSQCCASFPCRTWDGANCGSMPSMRPPARRSGFGR